ncbi:unnamed protein product [Rangifer tarandus platyrhynchus]|uniref:Uncharacterized protein n=1 Tax=Rangifer tarandus platyrhynchus TaxID=3082113 RepID=A0ABN8ZTT1_RANTA|nr:unnamed protein product [Rangifer tarandus platyrhynchus]
MWGPRAEGVISRDVGTADRRVISREEAAPRSPVNIRVLLGGGDQGAAGGERSLLPSGDAESAGPTRPQKQKEAHAPLLWEIKMLRGPCDIPSFANAAGLLSCSPGQTEPRADRTWVIIGRNTVVALILSKVADPTAPPLLWDQTASESPAPSVSESLLSGAGRCLCGRVLCGGRRPRAVRLPQDHLLAVGAAGYVLGPHAPRTSTLDADSGFRAFSPC